MKTKLLFLILFVLMMLPACGDGDKAKTQTSEYTANTITLAMPSDWIVIYNEKEKQILIGSPLDEYTLGIQILLPIIPHTSKEFAILMSKELDGEAPLPTSVYGDYTFDTNIMNVQAHITILTKDGYSMVLAEIGDYKKFSAQAKAILQSMKSSNSNFQNVIDSIKY